MFTKTVTPRLSFFDFVQFPCWPMVSCCEGIMPWQYRHPAKAEHRQPGQTSRGPSPGQPWQATSAECAGRAGGLPVSLWSPDCHESERDDWAPQLLQLYHSSFESWTSANKTTKKTSSPSEKVRRKKPLTSVREFWGNVDVLDIKDNSKFVIYSSYSWLTGIMKQAAVCQWSQFYRGMSDWLGPTLQVTWPTLFILKIICKIFFMVSHGSFNTDVKKMHLLLSLKFLWWLTWMLEKPQTFIYLFNALNV